MLNNETRDELNSFDQYKAIVRLEVDGASNKSGSRMVTSTLYLHDEFGIGFQDPSLREGLIEGSAFIEPEKVYCRSKETPHTSLKMSVITQPESEGFKAQ